MTNKISIIGAGNVGILCAQRIVERGYTDVVLWGRREGLPQGKALDILESAPILGFDSQIIGTNSYKDTDNSDVILITAGVPRPRDIKNREEMLIGNMKILNEVVPNVIKHSPDCIIIVCTNPTEPMTHLALHISKFPRSRIIGLSGVTDSARLASFIATELNVSVQDISACVLGQHGKAMVVVPRLTTVNDKPITEILSPGTIDRLIQRTIDGGSEINRLIKDDQAWSVYTPSAALAQMAEAIILDQKKILPCATYLQGEYGIENTVIGVPVKLGRNGIEQVVELELIAEEKAALISSVKAVQEIMATMKLN